MELTETSTGFDIKLNEKGRGKFKPAPDYKIEDVKRILEQKIIEENAKILDSKIDNDYLHDVQYRQDKINVISLFSGCGGLDLGFELAGLSAVLDEQICMQAFKDKDQFNNIREESVFHTIYSNDLFKEANASYKRNFPNTVVQHELDIRRVRNFPKADLVIGGFPCPGFSEAGPRLIDDERNFLYIHFIRCLTQAKPDVFVAENVKGMLTLGKGEVIKQIAEDFSAAGYRVQYKLLNSRDYGVPQLRERVFLVGVREDLDYEYNFPEPSHGDGQHLLPYVTLRDAIGDLEKNPGPYFTGSYSSIYMSRNRKKKWDDQSFTIQASGRQAPLHPGGLSMEKVNSNKWIFPNGESQHRRLSVREIARIQTFPDWFYFDDGENDKVSHNNRLDKQYKQIGNAVPVLLAKAVADPIAKWAVERVNSRDTISVQQLNLF
ncbi:DNA (cytosine-5-)-methyltransferase [Chryseomicrobium excrementi]|uniref:Cytosine-specific methyltransferase n=1 Tax=Chryseomicrobium excrementi TaxID=2041346 RepID=A0A2M9EYB0_9BACL|nr:DNA cytosine methyltransferase [Chryseomicrobium excrementi]PJK16186.1 DNA (cytosine-5-)-methyltransferase [Chryseomicrobium excrementi]